MLSNAYFLAKNRFDTAENEPAKNLQYLATFCKPSEHARYLVARVADLGFPFAEAPAPWAAAVLGTELVGSLLIVRLIRGFRLVKNQHFTIHDHNCNYPRFLTTTNFVIDS